MPISDPPPDPTYFRVLLSDPEGYDPAEVQRLLVPGAGRPILSVLGPAEQRRLGLG